MARYRNVSGEELTTSVDGRWVRCRPGDVITVPDRMLLSPALFRRLDNPTRAARKRRAAPAPEEG